MGIMESLGNGSQIPAFRAQVFGVRTRTMTAQERIIQRAFLKALILLAALFSPAACQGTGKVTPLADPQGAPHRVYVIGHRGAAGLAPENTVAAFRKALELGVDAVEMDALLTADGEIVVHHDFCLKPEIARTPTGMWIDGKSGPVIKNLTLADLKTYDVGRLRPHTLYASRYPDQQPADGERIPTLREVISLLKSRNDARTQLWIEIKTSPESPEMTPSPEVVADAVLKVLKEEDVSSRASILSFDWRSLVHVQKAAPHIPTVYLSLVSNSLDNIKPGRPGPSAWTAGMDVDDFNGSIPRAIKAAGGRCWGPHYKSVTPAMLQEAHELGLKVFPWTPDSSGDMHNLMKMKVDGIITNRPDILKSILSGP